MSNPWPVLAKLLAVILAIEAVSKLKTNDSSAQNVGQSPAIIRLLARPVAYLTLFLAIGAILVRGAFYPLLLCFAGYTIDLIGRMVFGYYSKRSTP